jgi:nitronate monooxygenase
MAGGPFHPALAAAVCNAGGPGFLTACYHDAVRSQLDELRELTDRPFGLTCSPRPARQIQATEPRVPRLRANR